MESEISFVIHWTWVIWTASIIAAIISVGGIAAFIGYQFGDTKGYSRGQESLRPSNRR